MFKKNQRISRTLFAEVAQNGRVYHSENITFRVVRDKKLTSSHISFVISKKIAKKAVDRNKLRRKGYAAVRSLLKLETKPFIGVFFVKRKIQDLSPIEYRDEIQSLLRRARVL